MIQSSINFLAVGVSGLTSTALSFFWFTMLFRQPYLDGLGKTAGQLAKGPSTLEATVLQVVGNLVTAYVLAWLLVNSGQQTVMGGLRLGLLAWVGFVAAIIGPMYAYQAFSLKFFAITAGYALVALLVMGAILGTWK